MEHTERWGAAEAELAPRGAAWKPAEFLPAAEPQEERGNGAALAALALLAAGASAFLVFRPSSVPVQAPAVSVAPAAPMIPAPQPLPPLTAFTPKPDVLPFAPAEGLEPFTIAGPGPAPAPVLPPPALAPREAPPVQPMVPAKPRLQLVPSLSGANDSVVMIRRAAAARVADKPYRIVPCDWKVQRQGQLCIDGQGTVTTQDTHLRCAAWGATDCKATARVLQGGEPADVIPVYYNGVRVRPGRANFGN